MAPIPTRRWKPSSPCIDRVLAAARLHIDGQRKRRKGMGSAIRRRIPVRTFADWRDPPPGFFEIDMVERCGGVKTEGEFVHTLTMTDIATGWTECVAMRVHEQMLVIASFDTVAAKKLIGRLAARCRTPMRVRRNCEPCSVGSRRAERAKEMILGCLRKAPVMPAEV